MKLRATIAILLVGLLGLPVAAAGVAAEDAEAIQETVKNVPGAEREFLDGISAESLTTFAAHNQAWVKDKRCHRMKIVYQDDRIAVVHAVSDDFYDVCRLIKINGGWKILHVLWATNQEKEE